MIFWKFFTKDLAKDNGYREAILDFFKLNKFFCSSIYEKLKYMRKVARKCLDTAVVPRQYIDMLELHLCM